MANVLTKGFNEALSAHFKQMDVKVVLRPEQIEKDFNGDIEYFYSFMKEQQGFWVNIKSGNLDSIHNHFKAVVDFLDQAYNNQVHNPGHAQGLITNAVNKARENNWINMYSSTEVANFIKEQYEQHPDQAQAVVQYIFQNSTSTINNKFYLKGILNTFIWEEKNEILKPNMSSQKRAMTELRKQYSKDRDELYGDFKAKHREITEMYNKFQLEIETWKQGIENSTSEYVTTNKEVLEQFKNDKQKELENLEKLYKENLILSGPAAYWNGLYNEYLRKGRIWLGFTIGFTMLLASVLLFILFFKPTALFTDGNLTWNTLRATIIFVLLTSVMVYLIRLFVMLCTSAYHLARDAKERYQLTFVYLALIKEKGASEAERSIILQSLFSRADTGLLKGDSSPTMPDSAVSQLLKGAGTTGATGTVNKFI